MYWVLLTGLLSTFAVADNQLAPAHQTITPLFWSQLYNENYHTLYCALNKEAASKIDTQITPVHVYPTPWLNASFACNNTATANNCPTNKSSLYQSAATDLHNLWPALSRYSNARASLPFIEIAGENMLFPQEQCDFEKNQNGIEPRDYAKGEIARTLLYMLWKYRLADHGMLTLLVNWANTYPVTHEETWRNDKIEKIQGNRNPFIDNEDMASLYLSIR